jgi:hypothetical protein
VISYHALILQGKKLFAKRSLVGFVLSPLTPKNEVSRTTTNREERNRKRGRSPQRLTEENKTGNKTRW